MGSESPQKQRDGFPRPNGARAKARNGKKAFPCLTKQTYGCYCSTAQVMHTAAVWNAQPPQASNANPKYDVNIKLLVLG
jgi:hypothetical protein